MTDIPSQFQVAPVTALDGSEHVLVSQSGNIRRAAVSDWPSGGGGGGINNQSGTTYILQSSDNGAIVNFTSGSAITLTVPSGLGAAFECGIVQGGAGQVTVSAAGGVSVNNRQSFTKTAGQYALVSLVAVAADTFIFAGDGA